MLVRERQVGDAVESERAECTQLAIAHIQRCLQVKVRALELVHLQCSLVRIVENHHVGSRPDCPIVGRDAAQIFEIVGVSELVVAVDGCPQN